MTEIQFNIKWDVQKVMCDWGLSESWEVFVWEEMGAECDI